MPAVLSVSILALLAGIAMPFGAWLAKVDGVKQYRFSRELHHSVLAFGAGVLLAAVAFVLVPHGIAELNPLFSVLCFICGGLAFMGLDILLLKWQAPASQLIAMLADFIPEAVALGATFIVHRDSALLLAVFIALQNIPEGFNAYRELRSSGQFSSKKILSAFLLMSLLGPVAAVIGLYYLYDSPQTLSVIMLFAAGAILYSVFQDIAPKVVLKNHRLPPMGAVLGFSLGLLGYLFIEGG